MNKRGVGVIGAVMLFIVFIVIWFVWLGGWVNEVGAAVIAEDGLVGIEAFFYSNLNFMILICMILGMIAWTYLGSG